MDFENSKYSTIEINSNHDEEAPLLATMSEEKIKTCSTGMKLVELDDTWYTTGVLDAHGVINTHSRGATERLCIKIDMLHKVRLISEVNMALQIDQIMFQKWNAGNATLMILATKAVMQATEAFKIGQGNHISSVGTCTNGFKESPGHRVAIPHHK